MVLAIGAVHLLLMLQCRKNLACCRVEACSAWRATFRGLDSNWLYSWTSLTAPSPAWRSTRWPMDRQQPTSPTACCCCGSEGSPTTVARSSAAVDTTRRLPATPRSICWSRPLLPPPETRKSLTSSLNITAPIANWRPTAFLPLNDYSQMNINPVSNWHAEIQCSKLPKKSPQTYTKSLLPLLLLPNGRVFRTCQKLGWVSISKKFWRLLERDFTDETLFLVPNTIDSLKQRWRLADCSTLKEL